MKASKTKKKNQKKNQIPSLIITILPNTAKCMNVWLDHRFFFSQIHEMIRC